MRIRNHIVMSSRPKPTTTRPMTAPARNATVSLRHVPTLRKYLDESRPQLVHHKAERALFLNRLGQRLTRQGLWQIVKTYAKQAKLGGEVTLRALRHSFVANTPKTKA